MSADDPRPRRLPGRGRSRRYFVPVPLPLPLVPPEGGVVGVLCVPLPPDGVDGLVDGVDGDVLGVVDGEAAGGRSDGCSPTRPDPPCSHAAKVSPSATAQKP